MFGESNRPTVWMVPRYLDIKNGTMVHLHVRRKRVLIADLDPLANATEWYEDRSSEEKHSLVVQPTHSAGLTELERVAESEGVDWLIFDTQAGTDATASRAVESADMVLVTCRPSTFDRNGTRHSVRLCRMHERTPHVLLTQTEHSGSETDEVRAELSKVGVDVLPCVIGRRKAFSRSQAVGQGAIEYEPNGKAAQEAEELYRCVSKHKDLVSRYRNTKVQAQGRAQTQARRGAK